MQTSTQRICSTVARSLLLLAAVPCIASAAEPVKGTAQVRLDYVFATLQNGTPDPKPEDTAACRKQTSAPDSRYFRSRVSTRYSINTQTLIMSASSALPSPQSKTPLELTVPLSALGIAGQYAFGAFRPPVLPNTYVLFSIDLNFKAPKSSVLVLNNDKDYNCLVSSDPKALSHGLDAKYGAEQK